MTLAAYDPAWPERYTALAREIRDALGYAVVLLEHVGSTSVSGLVAKPIIVSEPPLGRRAFALRKLERSAVPCRAIACATRGQQAIFAFWPSQR